MKENVISESLAMSQLRGAESVKKYLRTRSCDIATESHVTSLVETWLTSRDLSPELSNYNCVRTDNLHGELLLGESCPLFMY